MAKHGITTQRFLMVGNSLKSDILPVIAMGGCGVYIPYKTTWVHESVAEEDWDDGQYVTIENITFLPALLDVASHKFS